MGRRAEQDTLHFTFPPNVQLSVWDDAGSDETLAPLVTAMSPSSVLYVQPPDPS